MTGIHVAEDVCWPVAHRQVVFTIPKRLRVHARFDRKLLGKLSSCAWACIKAEVQRMLNRQDVVPGMIAAIQTFGQLAQWNPLCGAPHKGLNVKRYVMWSDSYATRRSPF